MFTWDRSTSMQISGLHHRRQMTSHCTRRVLSQSDLTQEQDVLSPLHLLMDKSSSRRATTKPWTRAMPVQDLLQGLTPTQTNSISSPRTHGSTLWRSLQVARHSLSLHTTVKSTSLNSLPRRLQQKRRSSQRKLSTEATPSSMESSLTRTVTLGVATTTHLCSSSAAKVAGLLANLSTLVSIRRNHPRLAKTPSESRQFSLTGRNSKKM